MKKLLIVLAFVVVSCNENSSSTDFDFTTVYEKSNGQETATYGETIAYYTELAKA